MCLRIWKRSSRNIKLKQKKQSIICTITSTLIKPNQRCTRITQCCFWSTSRCMHVPSLANIFLPELCAEAFRLRHSTGIRTEDMPWEVSPADRKETYNKSPTFGLSGLWEEESQGGEAEGYTCVMEILPPKPKSHMVGWWESLLVTENEILLFPLHTSFLHKKN